MLTKPTGKSPSPTLTSPSGLSSDTSTTQSTAVHTIIFIFDSLTESVLVVGNCLREIIVRYQTYIYYKPPL